MKNKTLSSEQQDVLLKCLKSRFEKNMHRHSTLEWYDVETALLRNPEKFWSLNEMEQTGGEPEVISWDIDTHEYIFCDCVDESPTGRRSLCYDRSALNARKENKPKNSVEDMAKDIGIKLLTEEEYRALQKIGNFDTKTSSWIATPENIRKLGGALFCDRRYETVFTYHNGADSYYAARGFRGILRV